MTRGVVQVDPADLSQGIDSFLWPEMPRWTMRQKTAAAVPVLVVTVPAPRPGDPLFTLQKELWVVLLNGRPS